jgi:hypothetical protein
MRRKKAIIISGGIIVVFAVLYAAVHFLNYGSFTRSCEYTETALAVPEPLSAAVLTTARTAYVGVGRDADFGCLKQLGSIRNEIIGPEAINNVTVGKKYFERIGLTVLPLPNGTTFRVTGAIRTIKHGLLSTIDSGPGPLDFLVLKDTKGDTYSLATVSLGMNEEDWFLTVADSSGGADSSSTVHWLNVDNFEEGGDAIVYKKGF